MKALKLICAIVFCELIGIIGGLATYPAIDSWYKTLTKPSFNPPDSIFGPVWTILYLIMGITLYLILIKKDHLKEKKTAFNFFFLQLGLNLLWTFLFFAFHNPFLALLEIVILWFVILLTIIRVYKISKFGSLILILYLAWVTFAAILNYAIWQLN